MSANKPTPHARRTAPKSDQPSVGKDRAATLPWTIALGALAGAGAALAGYAFLFEPIDVRTERLDLRLLRQRAGLPRRGLRILHLSDTHFRGWDWRERPKIEQVRRAAADARIDLLLHTGDFLHDDNGLENILALFDSIPEPRLGAFAVTGNHDLVTYLKRRALQHTWQRFREREENERTASGPVEPHAPARPWRRLARFLNYMTTRGVDGQPVRASHAGRLRTALEARGVTFLDNRAVQLDGTGVWLAGTEDLREGRPDLNSALRQVPGDAPTILMSHNPDIVAEPAAARADLILAGHTHGGQIVLPLVGPAYTQTERIRRSEAAGLWRRRETRVYVHRGVGESVPARFGAPPHVTFLRLLPAVPPERQGLRRGAMPRESRPVSSER